MLYRIVYKSKTKENDVTSISDIIVRSIENNIKDNITGLLISTNTEFIQVLEGPYQEINNTFIRIARDERHSNVQIISFGAIEKRSFEDWSMKGVNFNSLHIELRTYLSDKYGTESEDLKIPNDPHLAYSMLLDISYHFIKSNNQNG